MKLSKLITIVLFSAVVIATIVCAVIYFKKKDNSESKDGNDNKTDNKTDSKTDNKTDNRDSSTKPKINVYKRNGFLHTSETRSFEGPCTESEALDLLNEIFSKK